MEKMMKSLYAAVAAAMLIACPAAAVTFEAEGTISVSTLLPPGAPDPFETAFSISTTINAFTGDGIEQQAALPLASFDPITIGTKKFDTSNTFAQVSYVGDADGGRLRITIYGLPLVGTSTDESDFRADFTIRGVPPSEINGFRGEIPVDRFFFNVEGGSGLGNAREFNSSLTANFTSLEPVPLPAGAWLLISGLAGLALARRNA